MQLTRALGKCREFGERAMLHTNHKPGAVIEMDRARYQVAKDGSYRRIQPDTERAA